jgi:hypothetical protein
MARPTGALVTHQFTYYAAHPAPFGTYDVHWRLSDPQLFSDLFSHDELARAAVPLPAFGPAGRALGDVHALLVACTHRVAHHYDSASLLWLYDIDLLARRLGPREWEQAAALASEKRIRSVCLRGLRAAAAVFGTPVPSDVWEALTRPHAVEPTAVYLRGGLRRVDLLTSDLRALGWKARLQLLREHLFPQPAYMMRSYGRTQRALLPALYLHRIACGAMEWFRPLR